LSEQVIGDRFRVVAPAGSGGMATVYRAVDAQTGDTVAVKLLDADYDASRFEREVEVLSALVHPRIVRYLAHGLASERRAYLAMEWLEGEDLAQRLASGGLGLRDALHVVRDLAEGLAAAHALGIVHRDLKPSNVYLRGGRIEGTCLLDFGVARRLRDSRGPQTRTGALVGTPNYMAPEQASGERSIGPEADVFALGCILYECLIGSPPFVADHLVGVLAKILFADAESIASLRPDVPENVVRLVAAMLTKDPNERPRDAAAVVARIDALGDVPDLAPPGPPTAHTLRDRAPPSRPSKVHVTNSEQHLVCLIVATAPVPLSQELRERHGIEMLSDGSYVATVLPDGRTVATDQAVHAARIALDIREHSPGAQVALTTGRGVLKHRLPIGDAIDRAVRLLPREPSIVLDELSSALLDRRFEITQGSRLVGEIANSDSMRMLLGKPTTCVGREQELATLEAGVATCIDESTPSAVIVTAAPGMGKTRLAHELERRVSARHEELEIITGKADVSRAGATYGVLASALADLRKHHDLVEHVDPREQRRVGELLAELVGEPVASPSPELVRAKSDPRRLGDEIANAFLELLRAETRVHPVLIVLVDVHWADAASLRLVERGLMELSEQPLFVVALSRPLADDRLWAGHALRLPLRPLSRKACERLANQVLGNDVPRDVVARIVEQAAGNALFLEELIRAVAEGRRELPSTVLAMLQSRIAALSPELRRVLRTASVFGERFRRDGVSALLGDDAPDRSSLDGWLAELTRLEIIEPKGDAYTFRHALVVDAAYGLLTLEDRQAAHLAAAAYLDGEGGHEPIELAEHYQKAGAPALAVPCYLRAGHEANAVGDLATARLHLAEASDALRALPDQPEFRRTRIDILLQQVQMGIMAEVAVLNLARVTQARELLATLEHDPTDRRRELMLDYLSARVFNYMGNLREARGLCDRVIPLARELADDNLVASATQVIGNITMMQGQVREAEPLLARGVERVEQMSSEYDRIRFMSNYAMCLMMAGRIREAMALHDRALAHATASANSSSLAVALSMRAFSERASGDPAVLSTIEVAREHTLRSNERLLYYLVLCHHAWVDGLAGRKDAAREHWNESKEVADELGGQAWYDDLFVAAEAQVAVACGEPDRAIAIVTQLAPRLRGEELALGYGLAEQVWGLALAAHGDAAGADEHLHIARGVYERTGQRLALARLLVDWGRIAPARADALRAEAVAIYTEGGAPELVGGEP
jgi:serine/threonine protein kinase/tetratricopeptide (TPR) repeat protein